MRIWRRAAVALATLGALFLAAPTAGAVSPGSDHAPDHARIGVAKAKDAVRAAPDPKLDLAAAATFVHLVNYGSGQCLAVPGGSLNQGTGLIQWPCGAWNDHYWNLEPWTIGGVRYYRVINYNSNQCLAVPGGSRQNGVQVIQWGCGTWYDHFWRFDPTGSGTYHVVNYNSGQCLAVEGGSRNAGAKAIQWPCGTWADHYWR
ncbi:RICIN domain-containing protein [Streptomyces melanogenes]|uniref:RICIN domain-containing protein n=1 Tax=Streptomyces melanogenes TaxID=67326 RepID=A0ABZ1XV68_9ACTN|nr:RICIN domain-containing protein [Streptomyces melanogenes]